MGFFIDQEHALRVPDLPRDLEEVLHILEPSPDQSTHWWWMIPILALLVLTLLEMRSRRNRPKRETTRPRRRPRTPENPHSLARRLARLRTLTLESGRFRQGCHGLAELLRQRGAEVESQPMTVWTSREISDFLGDVPLSRVMLLLEELQFGRKVPDASDFEGVCELAAEATRERDW